MQKFKLVNIGSGCSEIMLKVTTLRKNNYIRNNKTGQRGDFVMLEIGQSADIYLQNKKHCYKIILNKEQRSQKNV